MQKIIEKILDEARLDAGSITRRYEDEARNAREAHTLRFARKKEEIDNAVRKTARQQIGKALAREKLTIRKRINREKQRFIEGIIAAAVESLPGHRRYFEFLKKLIRQCGEKEGQILLSAGDYARYHRRLDRYLRQARCRFEMAVDREIAGGIIVKKDKTTYQGSLNLIAESLKNKLSISIAQVLFNQQEETRWR